MSPDRREEVATFESVIFTGYIRESYFSIPHIRETCCPVTKKGTIFWLYIRKLCSKLIGGGSFHDIRESCVSRLQGEE